LGAIDRGDADAAETVMQEHVANSEQGLRAVLAAIRRRGVWR
jgi:DNA-binding FadR family transcriptional regulator